MATGGMPGSLGIGAGLGLLVAIFLGGCGPSTPEPVPAPGPTVERGASLYNANCETCHGGATGGSMMDIPPRHNANGHTWHHPDCQLADVVLRGSGEMGEMMRRMMNVPESTPRMPAFGERLTREDVVAILAYVKTWWTEEQRAQQAAVTRQRC